MNVSKCETLIVRDKDGNLITKIKIGMIQINAMRDKSKQLVIQESKS